MEGKKGKVIINVLEWLEATTYKNSSKTAFADLEKSITVFGKTFLHKVAKTFCRLLHLHFVGNCKASCQI